ncbi:hypothetical protein PVK06_046309 [Gossypium arboreum]|uniref:Uncharacterized protein n=1 Tax=Gossypium arboreum TaxID=29729 RepID=A0ABR0MA83_GOSAR|nr:hypothetical protein PVK06_046309 [Gossypium arboreum]
MDVMIVLRAIGKYCFAFRECLLLGGCKPECCPREHSFKDVLVAHAERLQSEVNKRRRHFSSGGKRDQREEFPFVSHTEALAPPTPLSMAFPRGLGLQTISLLVASLFTSNKEK